MTIANVTLNNTFDEWRTVTNQVVTFVNELDSGQQLINAASNSAVLTVSARNIKRNDTLYITLNVSSNLLDSSNLNVATASVVNTAFLFIKNTDSRLALVSNDANTINAVANAAFIQANAARDIASAAFASANAGQATGNAGLLKANTVYIHANLAYEQANVARDHANVAFAHANAAFANANSIITGGTSFAAFEKANAALPNVSNSSFAGNLLLPTGNLTIGVGVNQGIRLYVNGSISQANIFPQIRTLNGSQFINLNANTNSGGWNDLMLDRDLSIIFTKGAADDGANLVIGPWTDSSFGYKQDGQGRHGFNTSNPRHVLDANGSANISGALTITGNVDISSGKIYLTSPPSPANITPFGVYGAGGQIIWDFVGSSVSYLDSNTIYFRSGTPNTTTRMTIDPSGNVGIGTTTPDAKMVLRGPLRVRNESGSANANVYVTNGGAEFSAGITDLGAVVGTTTSSALYFRTAGVDRMRISSSGGSTEFFTNTKNYGSHEIERTGVNADFYFTSLGGSGRRWLMSSGTSGSWSLYDSTGSNTRFNISGSSGSSRFFTANGNTTHVFASSSDLLTNYMQIRNPADGNGVEVWSDTSHAGITGYQGNFYIVNRSSDDPDIVFQIGPSFTERMRLNPTGNLLIGRADSTVGKGVLLDVAGAINASSVLVNGNPLPNVSILTDSANAVRYVTFSNTSSGVISALNVATSTLTFNPSSGTLSATVFNTLSDENKKDNIVLIEDPVAKTEMLRGVRFTWKDNGLPSAGLIAQDIEKVLPELVSHDKSVNYSGVIGLLVEAIKELNERIKVLENK